MSTINKTFLRVLLAIACCIALAFSLLPQAEAAMRADVVTAKVTLNGQVIDNKNAKVSPAVLQQHHLLSHDLSLKPLHGRGDRLEQCI